MKLQKARKIATQMMDEFGLVGYDFRFANFTKTMGTCSSKQKLIRLSKGFTLTNDEVWLRNTMLHEIAHALVGCEHGHDRVWQAACLKIGGDGKRYATTNEANPPKGAWVAICSNCGHKHSTGRKPRGIYLCAKCDGSPCSRKLEYAKV